MGRGRGWEEMRKGGKEKGNIMLSELYLQN